MIQREESGKEEYEQEEDSKSEFPGLRRSAAGPDLESFSTLPTSHLFLPFPFKSFTAPPSTSSISSNESSHSCLIASVGMDNASARANVKVHLTFFFIRLLISRCGLHLRTTTQRSSTQAPYGSCAKRFLCRPLGTSMLPMSSTSSFFSTH